jgi:ribosomal protein S18 acetylase RimI-like enzyme
LSRYSAATNPGSQASTPFQVEIRKYRKGDERAVRQIAADTAFFGQPVEAYLDDRELFCDFFYAYYTRNEAEHGWIAEVQGQVQGFLMGCPDTRRRARNWAKLELPVLARQLLQGKYHLGRKTWQYLFTLARSAVRQEVLHVDLERYPAHLHVNVAEGKRGLGLGRQLLEACIKQLRQEDSRGVHLNTTSLNRAACRLYEQTGFQILESCPTRAWERFIDIPVENLAYGLQLNPKRSGTSRQPSASRDQD